MHIKKSVKLCLLMFFMFVSFINISNAQSQYIKICEYNHTYDSGSTLFGGAIQTVNKVGIYYDTISDDYYVYTQYMPSNSNSVSDRRPVPYIGNGNVYIQSNQIDEDSVVCPTYGYYNHDSNPADEFCFANDATYCSNRSDSNTDFSGDNSKIYDINTELRSFLSTYSYDFEISDDPNKLANYKFSDFERTITNEINTFILNNFNVEINEWTQTTEKLDEVYDFIKNTSAYKEKVLSETTRVKNELDAKIDAALEDPDVTEEEKGEMQQNQQQFGDDLEEYESESNRVNGIDVVIPDSDTCTSYLGDSGVTGTPAWYLHQLFNIIKYGAIVLCLVLTIIEYVKAATSQDDNAIKKASQKTLKRVLIAVILFLAPTIIEFILELLGITGSCMPVD